ncbi:MAG: UvrD-helicase domain-containing protein [Actinobacteria bacterium]|nr:UvrD-helicase domain-containing protein [Actinomycetota bacterium]
MNPDDLGLKEGQLAAVKCLDKPLFIQAGAGAGKTHTLTIRLVYAVASDEESTPKDVGELLVITFTKKAAGELVSRIRSALRKEGLAKDALLIDGAWISTIHSMCSRILKAHGLKADIDPFFATMMNEQAVELELDAYNEALTEAKQDKRYCDLLSHIKAEDISGVVSAARGKLASFPGGSQDLCFGPEPLDVHTVMRQTLVALEVLKLRYDGFLGGTPAASKASLEAGENLQILIEQIKADMSMPADEESNDSLNHFAGCLGNFKGASKAPRNEDYKEIVRDEEDVLCSAMAELSALATRAQAKLIFELADKTNRAFRRKKDEINVLDLDDLLMHTYKLLKENPSVAEYYQEKFKLVMVDEFQDTDQLQIGMIEAICGPGARTLCTVGDEQQSIYGFRGADVDVYRKHRKNMASQDAEYVELFENFRSHQDILTATNKIFGQPSVFGNNLTELKKARDEEATRPKIDPGVPRIRTITCGGAVPIKDLRELVAKRIAEQFAELRTQGVQQKDMVILLRKMSNADIFAKAIREQGMNCIANGGSKYYTYPEVKIMTSLLCALANPYDEEALIATLVSPFFCISDDLLLGLSNAKRSARASEKEVSYFDVLRDLADRGVAGFEGVYEQFSRSLERVKTCDIRTVLYGAFEDSGWDILLVSQKTDGMVTYANIMKFVDLAEATARVPGTSIHTLAKHFVNAGETAEKQSAGTLISEDADAVRILTIHQSKGLEYPVVALGEFFEDSAFSGNSGLDVRVATIDNRLHIGLMPHKNLFQDETSGSVGEKLSEGARKYIKEQEIPFDKLGEDSVCDETGQVKHLAYLYHKERKNEEEELQRLFYVACTRAREILILTLVHKAKDINDKLEGVKGDLAKGLLGGAFPVEATSYFDFGGEAPGLATYDILEMDVETGVSVLKTADGPCATWREEGVIKPEISYETLDSVLPRSFEPLLSHPSYSEPRTNYSYSFLSNYSKYGSESGRVAKGDSVVLVDDNDKIEDSFDEYTVPANVFGSAFHLLAQEVNETRELRLPEQKRIDALCKQFQLEGSYETRLLEAGKAWVSSDLARAAFGYHVLQPEMPFNICITPEGERSFFLEGSIDLYCVDSEGKKVLIVDYKTGISIDPSENDDLEKRYEFQAKCYTYAAIVAGAQEIEVVYFRPEVFVGGVPQEFRYVFGADDKSDLEREIIETHSRAVAAQQC